MRFAVKSTVALIAVYLLMLGGFAFWMEREVGGVAGSLMEDTARLVGGEIAAAMSESALAQLLQGDDATRQRLEQIILDLTQHSDVVAAIAVVDETGRVVVSDDIEVGKQLALPAVLFEGTTRPQFLGAQSPFLGEKYHLFVPLLRDDTLVGYLRLALSSQRIANLYRRARRQIVFAALVGLAAIGAFGLLFHVQLSRRGTALARTLEATVRGETVPGQIRRDEFSEVLEAAGRLGRELNQTRERSTQAERRVAELASFMDVGVLLLRADGQLEFANPAARQLLGCRGAGELEQRWHEVQPIVGQVLEHTGTGGRVDVEVPVDGGPRRLRVEVHRPDDSEREGTLVLVKDRDLLDAFETDLRLATQMRGLARVYGALAHELKAPLGAMAINIELLTDALADDETDADGRNRQRRYAGVLREELTRLNRSLVAVLNQTTAVDERHDHFDLREIIRDLELLLAPQAKHQRVAFEVSVPDREVRLAGHRDRLKQALLNLATNALEAMPDGGRMDVSLDAPNGRAMISIRDSGPGIPPEVVEKIYGMYFTTKKGGTGIGLYVARSVVESHGGTIQVQTEHGQGTCFQVDLPIAQEA